MASEKSTGNAGFMSELEGPLFPKWPRPGPPLRQAPTPVA